MAVQSSPDEWRDGSIVIGPAHLPYLPLNSRAHRPAMSARRCGVEPDCAKAIGAPVNNTITAATGSLTENFMNCPDSNGLLSPEYDREIDAIAKFLLSV